MPLTEQSAKSKDQRSGRNVSLQHRHFAFIADVLRSLKPLASDADYAVREASWRDTVEYFRRACGRTNPAFDYSRFEAACDYC